jgi:hypothetical protein
MFLRRPSVERNFNYYFLRDLILCPIGNTGTSSFFSAEHAAMIKRRKAELFLPLPYPA